MEPDRAYNKIIKIKGLGIRGFIKSSKCGGMYFYYDNLDIKKADFCFRFA